MALEGTLAYLQAVDKANVHLRYRRAQEPRYTCARRAASVKQYATTDVLVHKTFSETTLQCIYILLPRDPARREKSAGEVE